jgi:hypothetical protein
MGSQDFKSTIRVSRKTPDQDAFHEAREAAAFTHGHGGYTGSLAEKYSFVMFHRAKSKANAERLVEAMSGLRASPLPVYRPEFTQGVQDKSGPAGAIRYPIDADTDEIIFFGSASS